MGTRFRPRRRTAAIAFGVIATAAFSATACTPTEPRSGPVALDESTTVTGTDSNSNGVRDDIDQAIANAPVTPEMRSYLTDSAKVEQRIMALNVNGDPQTAKDEAYDIASDANKLISCPTAGLDPADARHRADNLQLLIANTDAREAQEAAFSKLIDGRAFPAPTC